MQAFAGKIVQRGLDLITIVVPPALPMVISLLLIKKTSFGSYF